MKLLFVTDNGFSYSQGNYYFNNANIEHYSIATKYFEEIVFIARKNHYNGSLNIINNTYKIYLVNSVPTISKLGRYFQQLREVIEKEIKDTDLVMCFGLNGNIAYQLAKKHNVPTLKFVGSDPSEILKNMDSIPKKILAPFYDYLEKKQINNSDYVHYVSDYLYNKYPTKNPYIICSDASIRLDKDIINTKIEKYKNRKNNKIKIGLIGYTHNKIKGIDTAIKALSLLSKDYTLEVVGGGDYEWLLNLANKYGVYDRVQFLGVLNREEIFKWLDIIDIYIQPSVTEGMPRATLEAMSRGCPIIATNVGGLIDLVIEEDRIKVGDYKTLAFRINTISKNYNDLINKSLHSFEVAKKYNPNILNKIKYDFYENIKLDLV